jgi:hypothetical protein
MPDDVPLWPDVRIPPLSDAELVDLVQTIIRYPSLEPLHADVRDKIVRALLELGKLRG